MQNIDNPMIQIITDKQLYLIGKIHTVISKLKDLEQQYLTVEELISSRQFSKDASIEKVEAK